MSEPRYSGQLVDDYNLLKRQRPAHENNYAEIMPPIADHFKGFSSRVILQALDLGCGDGDETEYVLKADPRIKVLALDPNPTMLARLATRFPSEIKDGRLEFVCAKALDFLPRITYGSIDLVASAWTLHNFKRPERNQVLQVCYNILHPTGLFVNMDRYMPDDQQQIEERSAYHLSLYDVHLTYGRPDLRELMRNHHIGDMDPEVIMKEGDSLADMAQIGFRNMRFESRTRMKANLIATK